ncbi:MAG: helix-turn-helix transcriptional regulator [Gemmatimonadales bacterium]|nr:helix-turn-helix transcriptional regulator [Gemmatimonadales bacterium]
MPDANLGESMRRLREEQQLSLRALAERTGFSASFLSQVENGQASPYRLNGAYCRGVGCDPQSVLSDRGRERFSSGGAGGAAGAAGQQVVACANRGSCGGPARGPAGSDSGDPRAGKHERHPCVHVPS